MWSVLHPELEVAALEDFASVSSKTQLFALSCRAERPAPTSPIPSPSLTPILTDGFLFPYLLSFLMPEA